MSILMRTAHDRDGVRFSVLRNGVVVWSMKVLFGRKKRNRAGGDAFVEAALEQSEVAKRQREIT